MQWDDSPNAGFSAPDATPWLPLAEDYATRNVAAQESDPASMLSLYRSLAALRRAEPALNRGTIEVLDLGSEQTLVYRRRAAAGDDFLMALNFGREPVELDLQEVLTGQQAVIALSTEMTRGGVTDRYLGLAGNEGIILRLPR